MGFRVRPGSQPIDRGRGGEPIFEIQAMMPTDHRSAERYADEVGHMLSNNARRDRDEALRSYRHPQYEVDLNHSADAMAYAMAHKQQLTESLLDNFKTVGCVFTTPHSSSHVGRSSKVYTFKVPKDMELEPEDHLVVMAQDIVKVVQVVDIHEHIESDNRIQYSWVIQKVDTEFFDRMVELDKKVATTLVELEKRSVKRELIKEFAQDASPEELAQLETDLGIKIPVAIESKDEKA